MCYRTIQDPASQRLTWYKPPLTVLVIKKVRDVSVLSPFVQLVRWLIEVSSCKYIYSEQEMNMYFQTGKTYGSICGGRRNGGSIVRE